MTKTAAQPDALAANQARLDRCKGPHAFAAVDSSVPVFRTDHECAHCGGRVDWHRRHWYEQGLRHRLRTGPARTDELVKLITFADLPTTPPGGGIKAAQTRNMKQLLWIIWAHENEPMPRRRFTQISGLAKAQIDRTLRGLITLGVITPRNTSTGNGGHSKAFSINVETLRSMQLPDVEPADNRKRLTLDDARAIHAAAAGGASDTYLAERFGVQPHYIRSILNGDRWKRAMPKSGAAR